jgi:hypothetical protein
LGFVPKKLAPWRSKDDKDQQQQAALLRLETIKSFQEESRGRGSKTPPRQPTKALQSAHAVLATISMADTAFAVVGAAEANALGAGTGMNLDDDYGANSLLRRPETADAVSVENCPRATSLDDEDAHGKKAAGATITDTRAAAAAGRPGSHAGVLPCVPPRTAGRLGFVPNKLAPWRSRDDKDQQQQAALQRREVHKNRILRESNKEADAAAPAATDVPAEFDLDFDESVDEGCAFKGVGLSSGRSNGGSSGNDRKQAEINRHHRGSGHRSRNSDRSSESSSSSSSSSESESGSDTEELDKFGARRDTVELLLSQLEFARGMGDEDAVRNSTAAVPSTLDKASFFEAEFNLFLTPISPLSRDARISCFSRLLTSTAVSRWRSSKPTLRCGPPSRRRAAQWPKPKTAPRTLPTATSARRACFDIH